MKKILSLMVIFALFLCTPFSFPVSANISEADSSFSQQETSSSNQNGKSNTAENTTVTNNEITTDISKNTTVIDESLIDYKEDTFIDPIEVATLDTIIDANNDSVTLNSLTRDLNENALMITLDYDVDNNTGDSFRYMFNKEDVLSIQEIDDKYSFGLQGGCTDGNYFYFSVVVVDKKLPANQQDVDTRILCATRDSFGNFELFSLSSNLMDKLHHAGDMTYNSKTDQIVITSSQTGHHQEIYVISAQKLRSGATINDFTTIPVSCMVTSIDYDEINNQYVVGVTGNLNYFAVLDSDFNLISTLGFIGNLSCDAGWARQGIFCDENYIYALYYFEGADGVAPRENENGKSKLRLIKWNGDIVKTIYFQVVGTEYTTDSGEIEEEICEIENMFISNGEIFLNFFCRPRPNRSCYYYNLSDLAFHIQYCPDENVNNYNNYSNQRRNFVIRGISTPLLTNHMSNSGYLFTGWTAYRKEIDSWYCRNSDGEEKWIKTAELNSSSNTEYFKYVYNDNQNVANTGAAGDHVLMCAQWQSSIYFYIDYYSNGGSGTMSRTTVTHGTATPLRTNTFTKTVSGNARTFQGWHAYWKEQNKWYYKNTDGSTGWYQENCEPTGYVKYVYSDGQTVARTAWKGGHIQMHAVWDEFNIFYNANGAIIQPGSEREMQTAWYKSGNTNSIMGFDSTCFNENSPKTMLEWDGWHLYRREVDMWYYKSPSGSCEWYTEENAPSTWNKYLKEKAHKMYLGGTARPGEHLVLVAAWNAA